MKYLGNFAACEPWAAVGMQCDDCDVSWTGCWDNFQCPKCGKGELPWHPSDEYEEEDYEPRMFPLTSGKGNS
jgi:hypothetical protein